jgi:hypothetical protein
LSGSLGARMRLDSFGQLEQRQPSPIPKYLSRKNSPLWALWKPKGRPSSSALPGAGSISPS